MGSPERRHITIGNTQAKIQIPAGALQPFTGYVVSLFINIMPVRFFTLP
jgi:hypothetical protein